MVEPGFATGELVDDFHHFRAIVRHRAGVVTDVQGESVRYPWDTCPGASEPLKQLVGMRLEGSLRAASRHTSSHTQCTHMFDAAAIAIARLGRNRGSVRYAMVVPDRREGRARVELARDGVKLLAWDLSESEITGPEPFRGHSLGSGLSNWAEKDLDPDISEAVLLLQRACVISGGRTMDLERIDRADRVQPNPMGRCHTYQPERVTLGWRRIGSIRNLTQVDDVVEASLAPAPEGPN